MGLFGTTVNLDKHKERELIGFLLTTIATLNESLSLNGDEFNGLSRSTHKHLQNLAWTVSICEFKSKDLMKVVVFSLNELTYGLHDGSVQTKQVIAELHRLAELINFVTKED